MATKFLGDVSGHRGHALWRTAAERFFSADAEASVGPLGRAVGLHPVTSASGDQRDFVRCDLLQQFITRPGKQSWNCIAEGSDCETDDQ